jgi:hypothetical protein
MSAAEGALIHRHWGSGACLGIRSGSLGTLWCGSLDRRPSRGCEFLTGASGIDVESPHRASRGIFTANPGKRCTIHFEIHWASCRETRIKVLVTDVRNSAQSGRGPPRVGGRRRGCSARRKKCLRPCDAARADRIAYLRSASGCNLDHRNRSVGSEGFWSDCIWTVDPGSEVLRSVSFIYYARSNPSCSIRIRWSRSSHTLSLCKTYKRAPRISVNQPAVHSFGLWDLEYFAQSPLCFLIIDAQSRGG